MDLKQKAVWLALAALLVPSAGVAVEAPAPPSLQNPGFEEDLSGWESSSWRPFDQTSSATADSGQVHGGAKSARLENRAANDSRIQQTVSVEPGTTYKVSGWIRTERVTSDEGPEGANLSFDETQIHSASVKGTQDWQYRELWVKTADDQTEMAVQCRLGYFGSIATGTAWFDDLSIEKAASPPADAAVQPLVRPPGASGRSYWLTLAGLAAAVALLWAHLHRLEKRRTR